MNKFFAPRISRLVAATMFAIAAPFSMAGGNPDVSWSITVGSPQVYGPPPVVYVQPQPVYVRPRPVYVQPATVVHYGHPYYVGEVRHKKFKHHHGRHHHRHHGHYDY